jgi:hypothetical protein
MDTGDSESEWLFFFGLMFSFFWVCLCHLKYGYKSNPHVSNFHWFKHIEKEIRPNQTRFDHGWTRLLRYSEIFEINQV